MAEILYLCNGENDKCNWSVGCFKQGGECKYTSFSAFAKYGECKNPETDLGRIFQEFEYENGRIYYVESEKK